VCAYLEDKGIDVLDLADYLEGRDPKDLVVNLLDGHPNNKLHKEVAEIIYDEFGPW